MRSTSLGLVALLLSCSAVACGGSTSSSQGPSPDTTQTTADAGGDDTGMPSDDSGPTADTAPVVDHGAPSDTYPAFTPEMGQLVDNGGGVLTAPQIVTITWPGEPNADKFEDFGDKIGGTNYWKTLVSEYGVGAATSGADNHIRLTDAAPATFSDSDIDAWVAKNAGDVATSHWPAPTANTVYVLYLAKSTSLQMMGADACKQGIGGYHQSTKVTTPSGTLDVAYAVLPQCDWGFSSQLDEVTGSASHELAEAATDPRPQTTPGWVQFDENHLAFEFFQQGASENGDACEFFQDSFTKITEGAFSYAVQRQWSNKSAKAGHNPCVPVPSDPYFNTTPLDLETVTIDLSAFGAGKVKTKGYHVMQGETKTIPIGFYSDGKTDPWTIQAYSGNPITGKSSSSTALTLSVDKTTGTNGEKAYVTVTVNTVGKLKGELMTIVSSRGATKHFMPIMIGSL